MSNRVFVLNPDRTPLIPCTAKRARKLLEGGRATVFRRYPFTILLNSESPRHVQPLTLKLDPDPTVTGMALVLEGQRGRQCSWGAALKHRGLAIKLKVTPRRGLRSSRRSRETPTGLLDSSTVPSLPGTCPIADATGVHGSVVSVAA